MGSRSLLKHRILRWLFVYAVLLSAAVLAGGYVIHERVEHLAWESLLRAELDYYGQRIQANPGYRWRDTDTLRLFGVAGAPPLPANLTSLEPGLHDDMALDGVNSVVLIEQIERKASGDGAQLDRVRGRGRHHYRCRGRRHRHRHPDPGLGGDVAPRAGDPTAGNARQTDRRTEACRTRSESRTGRRRQHRIGGHRRCVQRLSAPQPELRGARARFHRHLEPRTAYAYRGDRRRLRAGPGSGATFRRPHATRWRASTAPRARWNS